MMAKINNKIILNVLDENKNKIFAVPNYIDIQEVFGYKICQNYLRKMLMQKKDIFIIISAKQNTILKRKI